MLVTDVTEMRRCEMRSFTTLLKAPEKLKGVLAWAQSQCYKRNTKNNKERARGKESDEKNNATIQNSKVKGTRRREKAAEKGCARAGSQWYE